MLKHPKIQPNGVLLHGKNDPNLRCFWCFKVKQSNIRLILVSDPELCTVCINLCYILSAEWKLLVLERCVYVSFVSVKSVTYSTKGNAQCVEPFSGRCTHFVMYHWHFQCSKTYTHKKQKKKLRKKMKISL